MKDKANFNLPVILFLIWVWLSAKVTFSGWPLFWGMIPLEPRESVWALFVALICTLIIFFANKSLFLRAGNWLETVAARRVRLPAKPIILIFLYFAFFFAAWTFRSRNHFMGDGWLYISLAKEPFHILSDRPLDLIIHQISHRFIQALGLGNGEIAYALLHCLLLPVFLWICWRTAGLVTSGLFEKVIVSSLMASTVSLQLFAGYVESYTLLHLWIVLYLYAGIKYFRSRQTEGFPWLVTLIFLLALLSHRSALALGPSLIFLGLSRLLSGRQARSRFLNPSSIVALIVIIVLSARLLTEDKYSSLFVPLGAPEDINLTPYSLFSIEHFWEKFNFLLLICPVAAVALPVVASRWRSFRKLNDPSFSFVFWVMAGCALFSMVVNPLLGIRDWDLLSVFGVPAALFSGWGLIVALKEWDRRNVFLVALALAAVAHGVSWVWVNSDLERGISFLDRVRKEDFHTGTGKLNLGYLLQENKFLPQAIRQYQLVTGQEAQNKANYNIGYCYLFLIMPDSTIHYYRKLYGTRWSERRAKDLLMGLALAFDLKEQPDSAATLFVELKRKKLNLTPEEREFWAKLMDVAGVRDYYEKRVTDNSSGIGALMFCLRFYTVLLEEVKLAQVYDHILARNFTLEQWKRLLEFAEVCGQKNYYAEMLEKAGKEYPELLKLAEGPE